MISKTHNNKHDNNNQCDSRKAETAESAMGPAALHVQF